MYLQRWHGWCHMKLQPSRPKSCVHHTTMLHVTSCKATYVMVYACLAVICHLHFWQNDRDLSRATAVTRGWNEYRNTSQHRKSTLEKKILPPLQQGFEPATFQSRVRRSNHWAIPPPLTPPVSVDVKHHVYLLTSGCLRLVNRDKDLDLDYWRASPASSGTRTKTQKGFTI